MQGRRRVRQQLLGVAGIIGFGGLVAAGISLNEGHGVRESLLTLLWLSAILGVMVGLPVYLYARQDITVGRLLLREGALGDAEVTGVGQERNGAATLDVALRVDEELRRLTFRLPIPVGAVKVQVGQTLQALHLPARPRAVGIVLPGHGLVTTR